MEFLLKHVQFDCLKKLSALGLAAFLTICMPAYSAGPPLQVTVNGIDPAGNVTPLNNYRWTLEEDVTRASVPGQHATKSNYSFTHHSSYMPVVATGKVTAGVETVGNDCASPESVACKDPDRKYSRLPSLDPSKRYYLSILPDDGYAMGGGAIGAGQSAVTIAVQKYPLPTAQLSVFVFEDNNPLNSQPDLPQEQGLAGFTILLTEAGGTYGASGGQVTQDAYGNPLGTTYKPADATCSPANTVGGYCYSNGKPIVVKRGSGIILSNASGIANIRNLFPAKYTIQVIPPVGSDWHQTTTIEGTKGDDAWVRNGEPSFFQEFGPPGHHVFTGFVHSGILARNGTQPVLNGTTTVTGVVANIHNSRPPDYTFYSGDRIANCWIGLNEVGGSLRAVYAAPCNADSSFSIPNVPAGQWELVVWDEPLDIIMATAQITVPPGLSSYALPKPVSVFRWFGRYDGKVFFDTNGDGFPDANETYGIPDQALNIRFRDGSIYQSTITNAKGEFQFNEVFPFFNWMIAEVDYGRFKATGATITVDAGGDVPPHNGWTVPSFNRLTPQPQVCTDDDVAANTASSPNLCRSVGEIKPYRVEHGVVLLEGMQTFLGQTNHIEFGKKNYSGQENGGIAGIVQYAITRAEDDPKYGFAENWEPGIPRVQVNLYIDCDRDGKPDQPDPAHDGACLALSSDTTTPYAYDPPDVDNYPFCWRDPASCGLTEPTMGPEDRKRSRTGGPTEFSYGDVVRWGLNPVTQAPYVGLTKSDGWDDAPPSDCPGETYQIPYGPEAGSKLDCYDGLRNWNQVRPAVFDGGYAFGSVAGQANLPNVKYIVEAVAPNGYFHQGNGDKNVVFGDTLSPSPLAEPFECVGQSLPVPQFLTLFPNAGMANPLYKSDTQTWRKCDMKVADMQPGRNLAPNFFLYTEAPVAGHGVGFILDDLSSEFDVNAPTFGEKHAPPHLPISLRDWTGTEIGRVYADEFGSFNFLVPSTFTINPPFPSGVSPNMVVACMNSPGPILDPATNRMVIDPWFNRQYSQFCYTLQYLPGKTTYLDTPVVPVAAFPGPAQNPLDCELGDGTPMIYSVTGPNNSGPWVPAATGGTIKIVSAGSQVDVLNPYYDPAVAGSTQSIKRDYGFGASRTPGSAVTLGGRTLDIVSWSADLIVATVPPGNLTGSLMVTRDGVTSTVGVTVTSTAPGNEPKILQPGKSIQSIIDAPTTVDGDLVMVAPGNYNESVIIDKKIRVQGWGALSTMINAAKADTTGLKKWRALLDRKIDATVTAAIDPDTGAPTIVAGPLRTFDLLPGQTLGISLSDNEPLLFGGEEAPGFLVVGKQAATRTPNGHFNNTSAARIDGFTITGSDSGGGILASGNTNYLQITNNRVVGNYGTYGGGVRVGHTILLDETNTAYGGYTDSATANITIANNAITQNGATETGPGGGISLGNGASSYNVNSNHVCGNFSMADGGGIAHVGLSDGGVIRNNKVIFNQTYNQSANPTGAGIYVAGLPAIGTTGLSAGTGSITVEQNLVQGNNAGAGAGGGMRFAQVNGNDVVRFPNNSNRWWSIDVVNNIIVDNVTGYQGGGMSIVDALRMNIVNNTIARNDSTATAAQAFAGPGDNTSKPQPAGIVSEATSSALLAAMRNTAVRNANLFSDPLLRNNIIVNNRALCWSITGPGPGEFGLFDANVDGTCNLTSKAGTNPVYLDLAVVNTGAGQGSFAGGFVGPGINRLHPDHSILTDLRGSSGYDDGHANLATDPKFVAYYANGNRKPSPFIPGFSTLIDTAATSDEGGNFIDVRYGPLTLWNCLNSDGTVKSPQSAANCPLFGDYHLADGSPAINAGAARTATNSVPARDFDGQARPASTIDIGADEFAAAVVPPPPVVLPALPALDNFDRANANTLGSNWTQLTLLGAAGIRVNANQAQTTAFGNAFWKGAFGPNQAAGFTLVAAPTNGSSLLLKATGNLTLGTYQKFVRVRYNAGSILVDATTTTGASYTNLSTLASGVSLAAGETMAAMCDASGTVTAWKLPVAGPAQLLGQVSLPVTGATDFIAGGGLIGMQMPPGAARVDDMRGGTLP